MNGQKTSGNRRKKMIDKHNPLSPYDHNEDKILPIISTPPNSPKSHTNGTPTNAMTISISLGNPRNSISSKTNSAANAMMALAMGRPPSPANSSGSEPDSLGNSTSATALRRMYFKSGRHTRTKIATTTALASVTSFSSPSTNNVPKLVVMNSSNASTIDTTINTSTDSASTLVTSVTATDTSDNCDSLDMGDISGQSEPLLSSLDEPSHTDNLNDSEHDVTQMELTSSAFSRPDISLLENLENEESSLSIPPNSSCQRKMSQNMPRTAPHQTGGSVHFLFDPPPSPKSVRTTEKNKSSFTFREAADYLEEQKRQEDNNKENKSKNCGYRKGQGGGGGDGKRGSPLKTSMGYKNRDTVAETAREKKTFSPEGHHRRLGVAASSYDQKDLTMFPFDREAIDCERIQRECFVVEEATTRFPFGNGDVGGGESSSTTSSDSDYDVSVFERKSTANDSPPNDIFQQYTLLSQQETFEKRSSKRNRPERKRSEASPKLHRFDQIASKFEQMAAKDAAPCCETPPLPDFRVDYFFSELRTHQQQSISRRSSGYQQQPAPAPPLPTHDILDGCQKSPTNAGAINVTPNPLEAAVCTQPRATIVVQQPSLSLDNTVETLLLKDEGDFISVEQGKQCSRRNSKLKEDNMRQLLDVTNTLTIEELRNFEMRYGSPHHNRSQSVKTPGSRASGRPNQLTLPQQRSRVASMPNTGVEEEYYRLRHFSITGKGVINRGDSLKSRRSRSNNSVASSNSSTEHLTTAQIHAVSSARTSATCSLASSRESSTSNPGNGPYRVLMLGSTAVGKSSLVSQFMTSEYLHAYDTSIDDESGEKSVSVLLSGEESELVFIDHSSLEMTPENCLSSYDPHGYCVIYSSADRGSFVVAERVLQSLWTTENIAQKAVILVGNKADLARSRVVTSEEGKAMATAYDCKFIETSVGINHNVDELLVGLLSQIRLKLENPEKSRDLFRKRSCRKSKRRACSPLGSTCLTGNGGTNPSTPTVPLSNLITDINTPPGSAQSSPRKYRGSRTSASLKVKGLLGRVWARDSKSKSCENLHVL